MDAVVDRYMGAVFAVRGGRMLRCIGVLDVQAVRMPRVIDVQSEDAGVDR